MILQLWLDVEFMKHRIALCFAFLCWLSVSPTQGSEPIPEAAGPEDRVHIPKLIKQLSDKRIPKNSSPPSGETYGGYAMRALVDIGIEAVPALTTAVETIDKESRWLPVQGLKRIGHPARTALPVLIQNLNTDLWSLRSEITEALAKIDPDGTTVIPSLKKMLRDENAYVREDAATGLGRYRALAETVVPALIDALKDESPNERAAAILSLGQIGSPAKRIVLSLLPLLHDRSYFNIVGRDFVFDEPVVNHVATVLSQFKEQRQIIVPALLAAYHDEQTPSKIRIIDALAHFGAAANPIVPDLVQAMIRFPKTKDRHWIREPMVLARLGNHASASIPTLRKLLQGRHTLAKLYAAGVLACIDPESRTAAFKILAQGLQKTDKNSNLIVPFLEILGPEAAPLVPDLLEYLRHGKEEYELAYDEQIFNIFKQIGAKAKPAIPLLIRLHEYSLDEHEIEETFLAIGPAALDALVESLEGETASPRIVNAIARFGGKAEKAIPTLIASAREGDFEKRLSLANALGSIHSNPTVSLPILDRLLKDKHAIVRAAAAKSIGRFGLKADSAAPQLRAALKDDFADVRIAAIGALGSIGADDAETRQAVAVRTTDAHPLVQLVAKEWMEKRKAP